MSGQDMSTNKAQKLASLIMSLTDDKDVATNLILEIWKAASPEQKTIVANMFAQHVQEALKQNNWEARQLSARLVQTMTNDLVAKAFEERREELLLQIKPQLADALKRAVADVGDSVQKKARELIAIALRDLR